MLRDLLPGSLPRSFALDALDGYAHRADNPSRLVPNPAKTRDQVSEPADNSLLRSMPTSPPQSTRQSSCRSETLSVRRGRAPTSTSSSPPSSPSEAPGPPAAVNGPARKSITTGTRRRTAQSRRPDQRLQQRKTPWPGCCQLTRLGLAGCRGQPRGRTDVSLDS